MTNENCPWKLGRFADLSKDNDHYSLINFQFSSRKSIYYFTSTPVHFSNGLTVSVISASGPSLAMVIASN